MNRYRVEPGIKVELAEWEADGTDAAADKNGAPAELERLSRELDELQDVLYAQSRHRLLIVLQGMDTSGKDGTIRHVFSHVDPLGVRVASFKAPSADELAHDYLWRVHREMPRRGEIVVFNRSHYEDVVITRVRGLVDENTWSRRYGHINDFERMLADEGMTIVKFYLHIDKDEQKRRLEARRDDPAKRWKFQPGDLAERKHWDEYMKAYEEAITRTSTDHAPWHIVPSNRKWYRNLVVASVLVNTLRGLGMKYPPPAVSLADVLVE